eukprot:CAMPEP_0181361914 /NCGR_PEP_ID=MMETSP1106-20121128/7639_1 /TAXON_ID=81844 /ORGANISM="Mantoniella antarctica, Strain SL-175" /LENGTH=236 /DNA_ID=CAMNT_0023475657 /DNA_START=204 /DNA_END=914 /DNA_ORIENTATION=-
MPHVVSCTFDYGEVQRERTMRQQTESTLHFLALRHKRVMRRLRTGQELAVSPHFNIASGGLGDGGEDAEAGSPTEEDSVWHTTYKMNYNQANSSSAGLVSLHLPAIKARKHQHHGGNSPSFGTTYPVPISVTAHGPSKAEFATLRGRLASPRGVNIGPLAQQLYPARAQVPRSLVQTSRYDFKLLNPAAAAKDVDEEPIDPAASNAYTKQFLGLTRHGMEVPIMSRTNSTFKMPDF